MRIGWAWACVWVTGRVLKAGQCLRLDIAVGDDGGGVGGKETIRVLTRLAISTHGAATALNRHQPPKGRCPVSVVTRFTEASGGDAQTYELEGVVDVDVPDDELAYACARCGLWKTMGGPRFLRCGGCKGRCYCSQEVSISSDSR